MKEYPNRRPSSSIGIDPLEPRVLRSGFAHVDVSGPPVAAAVARLDQGHGHADASPIAASPTVRRWSWLAGTYWYVPYRNLPAVIYDSPTGTLTQVADQTVFQVTGYREGYFWGKVVTQLGTSAATGTAMVGSVTPQGRVLLTFTATGSGSGPSVTQGYGTMQRKRGGWTMENQMFTAPGKTVQLGHWAYMVQTRPGMPSWNDLPSSGLSVPAFLVQVPGPGPKPVVS